MIELWGMKVKNETCLAIGEFAISWSQFENVYCGNCYKAPNTIEVDNSFVNDEIIASTIEIREELHSIGDIDIAIIERLRIRKNESGYETYIDSFLNKTNNSNFSSDDVIACIYVGNRIRNNLLHGEKDLVNLDKQINIFKKFTRFFLLVVESGSLITYKPN